MNSKLRLAALAVSGVLLAGPALAAKGGKPGGGGGGGNNSPDPCSVTTSSFPAVAYVVTSGSKRRSADAIMLASADGTCERSLHTLDDAAVNAYLQLHLHDHESGFLVWSQHKPGGTWRLMLQEFSVGSDNTLTAGNLIALWQSSDALTIGVNPRLSPDGSSLLIAAYTRENENSDYFSEVWRCSGSGSDGAWNFGDCDEPDVLLSELGTDTSVDYWMAAPTNDPNRFYLRQIQRDPLGPRSSIVVVDWVEAESDWNFTTLFESEHDVYDLLDVDPYDSSRLAWTDYVQPWRTPTTIHVCKLDDNDECGAGSFELADAFMPTWSRRGWLAVPSDFPSLYYRGDHCCSGFVLYEATYDGNTIDPLPLNNFKFWDAY